MTLIFMFPGQSSRYPGMLNKFAHLHPDCAQVIEQASEVLGRDLRHHFREENDQAYANNQDIQLGVFLANHMLLKVLDASNIRAKFSLGLSLGEWNHLVHIGALSFVQALRGVEHRGKLYDSGPSGAMASVFPISLEELEEVAVAAAEGDILEVVNRNSPRQQVLSGTRPALERALTILEDEFYVSAEIIERKLPMHSSLFRPWGAKFKEYLDNVSFARPRLPYLPNRLGQVTSEPTDFASLLSTHLYHPVLWRRSIDFIVGRYERPVFVEVGPRAILHNLLDRKWHKDITRLTMDHREDVASHQEKVLSRLAELSAPPHLPSLVQGKSA